MGREQAAVSSRLVGHERVGSSSIDGSRLMLFYQGVFAVDSRAAVGVEALAQVRMSPFGIPDVILPVGVSANMVGGLGSWVARQSCRDAVSWAPLGIRTFVNMSPRQLQEPGLVGCVEAALHVNGLEPGDIAVEITEVSPITPRAAATVRALHRLGVGIVLDDVEVTQDTWTVLDRVPVDAVKLDRSVVGRLRVGSAKHAIVTGLVSAIHGLGVEVVAEGVETGREFAAVAAAGFDLVQGYHFHRPVPPSAVADLADRRSALAAAHHLASVPVAVTL